MANDVFGLVGTTVSGAFRVDAVVAEGGFAVVYKAYHSGFRAPVALKCLKIPQYLSTEQRARFEQQFQAEAELLFKLSASIPTVVRPLHVEAVIAPDGSYMPFLALEWLEGETLDSVAKRRREAGVAPYTLAELVPALTPVARALERAHKFNGPEGPVSIVHRDMKPENVFVARVAGEGVMKILDFGIGKAKSVASQVAGRASQDDAGASSFTPAYGAPEQWMPKRFGQTGPWTDVWGLALTLVELLAGRPVVDGDQSAMMGTVLDPERRPTPRAEGVVVSDAVELVFQHALALDPRARYRDAGEFWTALQSAAVADVQRVRAHQSGAAYRAAGRSGAHAAVGPASSRALMEPIPDLVPPRPPSSSSATFEIELAEPARSPPARPGSGHYAVPAAARAGLESPASAPSSGMTPLAVRSPSSGRMPAVKPASMPPPAQSHAPSPLRVPSVPPPSTAGVTSQVPLTQLSATSTGSLPRPRLSHPPPGPMDAWKRFIPPGALVASGMLVTIADGAYAASSGEVWSLGPVRLGWLAAALALGGIAMAIRRLLSTSD